MPPRGELPVEVELNGGGYQIAGLYGLDRSGYAFMIAKFAEQVG
jgi:hypothetical protein